MSIYGAGQSQAIGTNLISTPSKRSGLDTRCRILVQTFDYVRPWFFNERSAERIRFREGYHAKNVAEYHSKYILRL